MEGRQGVLAIRGTTQQPDPRRDGEDVHICIAAERRPAQVQAPPPTAPPSVRSFYSAAQILHWLQRMHSVAGGEPPQGHIQACRERILDLLKKRPETRRRMDRPEEKMRRATGRSVIRGGGRGLTWRRGRTGTCQHRNPCCKQRV